MSAECQEPPPPRRSPATAGPEGGLPPLAPVLPLIPRAPARRRPLPDAIAVVRPLSLPRTAPPYDDQAADRSDGAPTRTRLPRAATPAGDDLARDLRDYDRAFGLANNADGIS